MSLRFTVDPTFVSGHVKQPHALPKFDTLAEKRTYQDSLWESSKALEALLNKMGFSCSRATGFEAVHDFYMNDDVGEFRMLSFVIRNPKMATKKVLVQISEWLQTLDDDYSVFVSNEYDDSLELFMLIVLAGDVYGELEEPSTAKRLGFDPASKLIGPISE